MARVARHGSAEVISKAERTAVRRSLHRMVRHLLASRSHVGDVLRSAPTKEKAIMHFSLERLCHA
jgi:hypothetical protein